MKRLFLLWVLIGYAVLGKAQSVLSQPVTLSTDEITLEQALYQLIEEPGVRLSFNNAVLPERDVVLDYRQVPLERVLEDLLEGTGLLYKEIGGQVVIALDMNARYVVSGFLKDSKTGEYLIHANVMDRNSGIGISSNAYGFFSLELPPGPAELVFSYTGYKTITEALYVSKDQRLDVYITPSLTLRPIEIIGHRLPGAPLLAAPTTRPGTALLPADVEALPALAGETDLWRTAQLLPGVQTGTDGVGGLHIRGGTNGQNLVMIDGVPIYNVVHAAGLFSVINTSAIRSATLLRSAIPARYGGRLSSVLDVRTKEGNRKALQVQGGLGTLAGRLTVDGPLLKNKSSFLMAGRLSLIDAYLAPLSERLGAGGRLTNGNYQFYDFNAKLNFELSRKDKLYWSWYSGSDRYASRGSRTDTLPVIANSDPVPNAQDFRLDEAYSDWINWGNVVSALRWNHLFGNRLFGNLALTYSGLRMRMDYTRADSLFNLTTREIEWREVEIGRYQTRIEDIGMRMDFDFVPTASHYVRFGAQVVHHDFRPGALSFYIQEDTQTGVGDSTAGQPINPSIMAWEYAAYLEDEFQLGTKWSFNLGLHASGFSVRDESYFVLEPRLLARYQARRNWQLEAYSDRTAQFIHLLSGTLIGLPAELWVPSTDEIAPETAWQFGLSSNWSLGSQWKLGLEGYYRAMNNLLSYSEGADIWDDWEQNVTTGSGTVYGLELILQREMGKTRGWVGYGLLWANRQFNRVNNGEVFPYRYDRRHEVKAALIHRLAKHWEISATWILSSGFAFSLPVAEYTVDSPGSEPVLATDFGTKNAFRMPYYHRLDAGINGEWKGRRLQHLLKFGVYNAYNQQNPLYFAIRSNFVSNGETWIERKTLQEARLIPLLPSLSYTLSF